MQKTGLDPSVFHWEEALEKEMATSVLAGNPWTTEPWQGYCLGSKESIWLSD